MTPKFIARQLSCPTGWSGRIIGRLMNRRNARMNEFALKQLELQPSDRVLEIGFGGGVTLPTLIAGAAFVAGLDRSSEVVRLANARFSNQVERGRAEFRVGLVEALPFPAAHFTKVCTVNTVYFWKSPEKGFAEMFRVLAPEGCAVVGSLPKQWMDRMGLPSDIFTSRTSEEISAALRKTGFRRVRIERADSATPWNVMVAVR
jgi:ubiquinone/menaquinone biosynthesis C-methylase UbiE